MSPLSQYRASKPIKVGVIGAGMVGSSTAYTLIVESVATEIVLLDVNKDRAEGEAQDIRHSLPFVSPTNVVAGDYQDCSDADIIVITAGVAQKAGESRLSLVQRNVEIYKDILDNLMKVDTNAIILVVSNPVDILTYFTIKHTGMPWQRVIGSGTVLDTSRFKYELGANCSVDPRSVQAFIIGEHGDSEVPVWSAANIGGVPLREYCKCCTRQCSNNKLNAIFEKVRNAAYEIIKLKGATYYAIALGTTRMIEAILRNQNSVVTASTLIQGQHGIEDVCLSLPIVLGADGVKKIIETPLLPEEVQALNKSAKILKGILSELQI